MQKVLTSFKLRYFLTNPQNNVLSFADPEINSPREITANSMCYILKFSRQDNYAIP